MSGSESAHPTAIALLDAVDEILMADGASALSLRQVEVVAGATHGSVRYHFDSLEGLLAAAFGRQNDQMVARQVEMYRSDRPMTEKWRIGSREFFDADIASGWSQRAFEASHLAINQPELREILRSQLDAWFELLAEVVEGAGVEYAVDLTDRQVRGVAMTVAYSQFGAMTMALHGGHDWHEDYLGVWDELLELLEGRRRGAEGDEQ